MLKQNMEVITNNPAIYNDYSKNMDIMLIDGEYIDVLFSVRDKIHGGYKVLTHPLMGSIKPNETPYRSIIVQKSDSLDIQSLQIIESSIETCRKFLKDKQAPKWSEKVLEDFRFVDKKLFESAMESIML